MLLTYTSSHCDTYRTNLESRNSLTKDRSFAKRRMRSARPAWRIWNESEKSWKCSWKKIYVITSVRSNVLCQFIFVCEEWKYFILKRHINFSQLKQKNWHANKIQLKCLKKFSFSQWMFCKYSHVYNEREKFLQEKVVIECSVTPRC